MTELEKLEKFERQFEEYLNNKYPNHNIVADDFDTWIQNAIDQYGNEYDEQYKLYFNIKSL